MEQVLSRQEASEAVQEYGWRFLLGTLCTSVPVGSLAQAIALAADAAAVCGDEADRHLRIDVRPERVVLALQSLDRAGVTNRDVELARRISAAAEASGLLTEPEIGPGAPRSVQARPQRNRIHFDICVPHDEAPRRIERALAAGGRLVSATRAPAFWVLSDLEENEICVTTWQGRDT